MVKIVKKYTGTFTRHHAERFMRIGSTGWRKPRGIDNATRRRYKGYKLMPNKGYGSARATKFLCPDGLYSFNIANVRDLEVLMMHNGKYAAVINGSVGSRTRQAIIARAAELNIKVRNASARVKAVEASGNAQ